MSTVHWLGAGLSTAPGIQRLAAGPLPLVVWNRTPAKAEEIVQGIEGDVQVKAFDMAALAGAVQKGDIVVSMLPGDWHVPAAQLCLERGAHFVSSSYISPEMRGLDGEAKAAGLSLVNEIGLDPGIDHLMAHALVADYQQSAAFDAGNRLRFRSYCGGFPKVPNDFRYKFSWSPLGVLRALKSPSRSIRAGEILDTQRPWDAISEYTMRLPNGESEAFEAYPNRDATPFIEDYQFDPAWPLQEFVRGTLRLQGWSEAWSPLFREIEGLTADNEAQRLREMSDELWATQSYAPGEPDRVVLSVELQAERDGQTVWHQGYSLDAIGDAEHSAMARLVSTPVSLAVEAVAAGEMPAGVSAASHDPERVARWMGFLTDAGEPIARIDYLAN